MMKAWARHSTVVLIVLIAVLLPVLAFVQYRWLGEIARLEQRHRTDSLTSAARRFSGDFDSELARLYQTFHVRRAAVHKAAEEQAADFAEWAAEVDFPEIVKAVYWVEVRRDFAPRLLQLDLERGEFHDVAWPPELEPTRIIYTEPGYVDPLQAEVPALVVMQHDEELDHTPWAIVVLDMDVIANDYLAERIEHFSGGAPIDYEMMIVENEGIDQVVYNPDPTMTPADFQEYEPMAEAAFFGLHSRDFRSDWLEALPTGATEHRWRVYVRHRPGALAAAVGAIRGRNLAVSFGILLLLAGSILLLLRTTRRAERWARLQLEYVARIAHELRTPLSVIGFASENLSDEVVQDLDKARTYGRVIHKESRRLTKLVESALLHSRLESGASEEIKRYPVEIGSLIDAALDDSDLTEVAVAKEVPEGLPSVMGDLEALKSAFQNLFTNAKKYGGGTCHLSVSARPSTLSEQAAVEIEVEDDGPGIPANDLPHIFEPFYRGHVAREQQIEGSGIGLSLVKHVVDAHGGVIRVSSPNGRGSRFTLLLPAGA